MARVRAFSKKSVYLEERLKNENPFIEDRHLTSLEKVQMITMLGIARRRLRYLIREIALIDMQQNLFCSEMKFFVRSVNS